MYAINSQDFSLETLRFPPRCHEPQRIFEKLFAWPDTVSLNNVQIPARISSVAYTLLTKLVTQAVFRHPRCTRYALNISF